MFKVKDAFRRIGPSSKRKDTPAPLQTTAAPSLITGANKSPKDLFVFDEINESLKDIDQVGLPTSESESCISGLTVSAAFSESYRNTSSYSIKSLKEPAPRSRKNSSQKTRSAEDLVALVNKSSKKKSSKKSRRAIAAHSYEPNKLLEKAIEESYADLVEGLITSGQVNINKLNSEGFAPLHFATAEGKSDIIQILIDCGAYIDILTNTGHSALEIAVMDGSFDCAQVLIENGADQAFVLEGPLDPRCSREMNGKI